MYKDYFGLKDTPFSIAPNPEYLYMSDRHREALAHLLYGIRGDGGFLLLTGEVWHRQDNRLSMFTTTGTGGRRHGIYSKSQVNR